MTSIYNKDLKNDSVKMQIIQEYYGNNKSSYEISRELGIPARTIQNFLAKDTHKGWHLENEEIIDKYFNGFGNSLATDCPTPEHQIGIWSPYKSDEEDEKLFGKIEPTGAKILYFDVETAPISAAVWGLWDNNVSLNMIQSDWYLLSFCAKWAHSDEVIYFDKRDTWNDEDDSELLQELWSLLDDADIVIGQNSKKFDEKKVNARFILNGMKPPSHYRSIDTMQIAKRHFGFTSNKLEYMTDKLCKKYKKLTHGKFAGYELWKQCLVGNPAAWDEMRDYNINDVLSLEELYHILRPYFKGNLNLNVYSNTDDFKCVCGNDTFTHNGYHYTNASKFDRFKCDNCGASVRGKVNLLSKEKRASLKANII